MKQLSTFRIADRHYALDIGCVQEVMKAVPLAQVHLAPPYVHGLINLRGQVVTAIGLRDLFGMEHRNGQDCMNVICHFGSMTISLLVDDVGDVLDSPPEAFETLPNSIAPNIKRFAESVCKTPETILTVLDVEKIVGFLNDAEMP